MRGNWTSQQLIGEVNRILDLLGAEDLHALPAESIGDDLKGLARVGSRIDAESSRRLQHFDKNQGYAASGALTAQAEPVRQTATKEPARQTGETSEPGPACRPDALHQDR